MYEEYYVKLAKEMLQVDKLPPDLESKLDQVNLLLWRVNGKLTSRQTIAALILLWEFESVLKEEDDESI